MSTIQASIKNSTSNNYNVHVFDLFGGGRREVQGSPFALTENEISPSFLVNAGADGAGSIAYQCDGGPSLNDVQVRDGAMITI